MYANAISDMAKRICHLAKLQQKYRNKNYNLIHVTSQITYTVRRKIVFFRVACIIIPFVYSFAHIYL